MTATQTPSRLGDTPASVVVITRQALTTTAAATTDDALRQVPGFTLFRRSGSRTANPTSQGVSLRGIGASGASRALVLDDGIPLNDRSAGGVYWARVPRYGWACGIRYGNVSVSTNPSRGLENWPGRVM